MNKLYDTDRLSLRILDEGDSESVLDYYLRNRDFLEEWEPKRGEEFYTSNVQLEQLRNDQKDFEAGRALRLWLFIKEGPDAGKIIGTIAFSNIVRGAFLSCFLGYKLDKDEINKGYITEALKKGIQIIFEEYGLHRIEANIMPKNSRSLRVLEKLGFYNEGLSYRYLKINGKWEDHIHMVLRNEKLE